MGLRGIFPTFLALRKCTASPTGKYLSKTDARMCLFARSEDIQSDRRCRNDNSHEFYLPPEARFHRIFLLPFSAHSLSPSLPLASPKSSLLSLCRHVQRLQLRETRIMCASLRLHCANRKFNFAALFDVFRASIKRKHKANSVGTKKYHFTERTARSAKETSESRNEFAH